MNINYINPEKELSSMESINDFIDFVTKQHAIYEEKNAKYVKLLKEKNITTEMIHKGCEVSESTAKRFKNNFPAKRHNLIQMCSLMGLGVKNANEMLKNAGFQRLYARDPQDFIWLHILSTGKGHLNPNPESDFKKLQKIFQDIYKQYANATKKQGNDTYMVENIALDNDKSFAEKAQKAVGMMYGRYDKLLGYIEYELIGRPEVKSFFAAKQVFSNHYQVNMKKLREHSFPDRNFLICLGINLSLSTDGINKLLKKAGMAKLCAHNITESFLYYSLEKIYAEYPNLFTDLPYDPSLKNEYDFLSNKYMDDCAEFIVKELEKAGELNLDLKDKEKILKFLSNSTEENEEKE